MTSYRPILFTLFRARKIKQITGKEEEDQSHEVALTDRNMANKLPMPFPGRWYEVRISCENVAGSNLGTGKFFFCTWLVALAYSAVRWSMPLQNSRASCSIAPLSSAQFGVKRNSLSQLGRVRNSMVVFYCKVRCNRKNREMELLQLGFSINIWVQRAKGITHK